MERPAIQSGYDHSGEREPGMVAIEPAMLQRGRSCLFQSIDCRSWPGMVVLSEEMVVCLCIYVVVQSEITSLLKWRLFLYIV